MVNFNQYQYKKLKISIDLFSGGTAFWSLSLCFCKKKKNTFNDMNASTSYDFIYSHDFKNVMAWSPPHNSIYRNDQDMI